MPAEPTSAESSTAPGPELLDRRSVLGVLVHLIALPTGVVAPGSCTPPRRPSSRSATLATPSTGISRCSG
ncbi:hypothetical protein [Halorubrum sp. CBA1125]|uniref:hypothetical protein n=1 Tax=Halorubrum sp. CBA1125 TaxID=2668072 RepID=UPI001E2F2A98|nr:hypothetical protein [Halorubrum sp. CBA1125]